MEAPRQSLERLDPVAYPAASGVCNLEPGLDRMVWLYQGMKDRNQEYASWLYPSP